MDDERYRPRFYDYNQVDKIPIHDDGAIYAESKLVSEVSDAFRNYVTNPHSNREAFSALVGDCIETVMPLSEFFSGCALLVTISGIRTV